MIAAWSAPSGQRRMKSSWRLTSPGRSARHRHACDLDVGAHHHVQGPREHVADVPF
jgi:hypothetical protein